MVYTTIFQRGKGLVAFDQFSTEHYEGRVCRWGTGPEKHGALSPCWFNAGQASATLAQH